MKFDVVVWLLSDGPPIFHVGERQLIGEDALLAVLPRLTTRATLLLLPCERVLPLIIEVPARSRRLLARALPFAIEEKLAVDLDTVHIAHGDLAPGMPTTARVVDKSYLDTCLGQARGWGLDVRSVQVDAERVPGTSDINLVIDHDRALLRQRGGKALAVGRAQLPFALGLAARAQGKTALEIETTVVGDTVPADEEHAALIAAVPAEAHFAPFATTPDALAALAGMRSVSAIELLQGSYAPARDSNFSLGPWRAAAIAAGVWALLAVGLEIGEGWWLGKHADQARIEASALYKNIFPGEAPPTDLRRAFSGHLGKDGPALGARPMLGILATALGGEQDITLESLSYQRERDELGVQLLARNLADLDRLKQTVERSAVQAQVNSAEQEANQVRARMRIRHGGQPG